MKFLWEDGTEVVLSVHGNFIGFIKGGERPTTVVLTRQEIEEVLVQYSDKGVVLFLGRLKQTLK